MLSSLMHNVFPFVSLFVTRLVTHLLLINCRLSCCSELDRYGMKLFANHVYDRVEVLYTNQLRAKKPKASDKSCKSAFEREKEYLLPGNHKSHEMTIKALCGTMLKTMDRRWRECSFLLASRLSRFRRANAIRKSHALSFCTCMRTNRYEEWQVDARQSGVRLGRARTFGVQERRPHGNQPEPHLVRATHGALIMIMM
jgi:hypothetical protein